MSYDVYGYRLSPENDVERAHYACMEAEENDAEPPPVIVTADGPERERIARLLLEADPSLEYSDDLTYGIVSLDPPEEEINAGQWCISASRCSVSWNYTKGARELRTTLDRVWPLLEVLQREGYRFFDPQLDRELNIATDREEVRGTYVSANSRIGMAVDDYAVPESTQKRAWWKFW